MEDIWAPGFDGVIECDEASIYVISGKSVWEFGTNDAPLKKIESDYQKHDYVLSELGDIT